MVTEPQYPEAASVSRRQVAVSVAHHNRGPGSVPLQPTPHDSAMVVALHGFFSGYLAHLQAETSVKLSGQIRSYSKPPNFERRMA